MQVRRACSSLRGELEGRLRALASRLEVAEVRLHDTEGALGGCAARRVRAVELHVLLLLLPLLLLLLLLAYSMMPCV